MANIEYIKNLVWKVQSEKVSVSAAIYLSNTKNSKHWYFRYLIRLSSSQIVSLLNAYYRKQFNTFRLLMILNWWQQKIFYYKIHTVTGATLEFTSTGRFYTKTTCVQQIITVGGISHVRLFEEHQDHFSSREKHVQ